MNTRKCITGLGILMLAAGAIGFLPASQAAQTADYCDQEPRPSVCKEPGPACTSEQTDSGFWPGYGGANYYEKHETTCCERTDGGVSKCETHTCTGWWNGGPPRGAKVSNHEGAANDSQGACTHKETFCDQDGNGERGPDEVWTDQEGDMGETCSHYSPEDGCKAEAEPALS